MTNERLYELRSLEVGAELPRYHDWVVDQFRAQLRGRVLELGAGIGTIAERYVSNVDELVLVEPAPNLHEVLARKFETRKNVRTFCGVIDEAIGKDLEGVKVAKGSFDTVILVNVLEHIEDDVGTLTALQSLLKPGGHLLVFVPALPFLYGMLDKSVGHVRRYTRTTLGAAAKRAGMKVDTMRYFDALGTVPWFVTGRILRQEKVGEGSASFYDDYIVPVCKAFDFVTRVPLGKNLVCIASKPAS